MKTSKEQLLSSAPVTPSIVKMAIPAILAMLVTALYNFVDTAYIGMLHDTKALTAVGIAFPIFMLIMAFGQLLGVGAATTIGRQLGAGNKEGANATATTVIATSFVFGVLFTGIGLCFMGPLFRAFGASEEVLPLTIEYGKYMFFAAFFEIPNQSFNSIARAETSTKTAAISLVIGAVSNIILDPIFMFTFNMGIGGAAFATALSQFISFLFIAGYFITGRSIVRFRPAYFKPSGKLYQEVFRSGTPVFISQILISVAVAATNLMIAKLPMGDNILAAYGVVLKVIVIGQYILFGYMQGYQPIASYAYGAKNKQRFYQAFFSTLKICIGISVVITLIYIFSGKALIRLFNQDPFIIESGEKLIISQVILFVSLGFSVLMTTLFQAIGQGTLGILVSSLRQGIAYIPLLLLFGSLWGFTGILLAQPVADVITMLVSIWVAKYIFKQFEKTFAS